MGFDKVYDYAAGKADWTSSGLPSEGTLREQPRAIDAARRDILTARPTETVSEARRRAEERGVRVCVVVNEDGVVLGRLRGDALEAGPDAPVESVMEEGPTTVRADADLETLTERMRERKVGSILVTTSDGVLLGILYRKDAEEMLSGEVQTAP